MPLPAAWAIHYICFTKAIAIPNGFIKRSQNFHQVYPFSKASLLHQITARGKSLPAVCARSYPDFIKLCYPAHPSAMHLL